MRKPLSIVFPVLTWPLLVFMMAPGVRAPLVAPAAAAVPLKVWSAVASWYGSDFQGLPTASGQPFDMFAPTAAHPWLPLGSLIRVINDRTGRSQIVRINDRGPFVDNRELDLSYLVAFRLGLIESGVNLVRIELLEVPRRP
jgi:rare lipoprotein A